MCIFHCTFYLLTNTGVACEHVGVLHHGLVGGRVFTDFEHTAPLGEPAAVLVVLCTPLRQPVQAWWASSHHLSCFHSVSILVRICYCDGKSRTILAKNLDMGSIIVSPALSSIFTGSVQICYGGWRSLGGKHFYSRNWLVVGPYSNSSNIRSFRLIFEYEIHIRIFEVNNKYMIIRQCYHFTWQIIYKILCGSS